MDDHQTYLKNEIIDITEDLVNYIHKNRKGVNNKIQFRIVFNQHLKNFEEKTRKLILDTNISPELKIETIVKTIPMISEALLKFPKELRHDDTWLDLSIVSNFAVLNIASQGRQNDKWRIQAAANILSKLLVNSPKVELDYPLDLDTLEKAQRIRNALAITSGVYLETIITIYDIDEEKLIEWSNNAFYHFSLYKQFLEELDLWTIHRNYGLKGEDLFLRIRFFLMPLWNSLVYILNLYRVYGENIPDEIDFHGYVVQGREGIINLTEYIIDQFNTAVSDLQKLYKNGIIQKNDNPVDSEHVIRLSILSEFAELYKLQAMEYQKHFNTDQNSNIKQLLDLAFNIIERLEKIRDPTKNRFVSKFFPFYVDLYTLILEYHALEPDERVGMILKDIEEHKDKHPELALKAIKIQLYLYLNGKHPRMDLEDTIERLQSLSNQFEYRYREWLDSKIIQVLLLGHLNKQQATLMIDKILSHIDEIGVRLDLKPTVLDYIDKIKVSLTENQNITIDDPSLVPFDYNTWLKLPFDTNVQYYPFAQMNLQINNT